MPAARQSYDRVAIALHWAIAAAIIILIYVGKWMTEALETHSAPQMVVFQAYQWHKSVGLSVLVLSLFRIYWRVRHKPPALPDQMSAFERLASHAAHIGFYGLMIGLPLTGWAMVSTSPWGLPTIWFGLFEWPHLPILSTLEDKKPVEAVFKEAHELLGNLAIGLIVLHVLAALKHQFINRDQVLARMVPWLGRFSGKDNVAP